MPVLEKKNNKTAARQTGSEERYRPISKKRLLRELEVSHRQAVNGEGMSVEEMKARARAKYGI